MDRIALGPPPRAREKDVQGTPATTPMHMPDLIMRRIRSLTGLRKTSPIGPWRMSKVYTVCPRFLISPAKHSHPANSSMKKKPNLR